MSEHSTTKPELSPSLEELERDPGLVARKQSELGIDISKLYANPEMNLPDGVAEIVLRNPAVYLKDVGSGQLQPDLHESWTRLLGFSDHVAQLAATKDSEWASGTSGLDKIQHIVFGGEVKPEFRRTVADIIRQASVLFGASTSTSGAEGNTRYYAGNVWGAMVRLRNFQQDNG
ncbi:MAG TPA: hypothetical protein VMR34_05890 [Candidatus Saccharimonadales bacterium]|nr:hypothetical protein [Candidatus Saccharimonadales bacterium]